jgi:HSP20 family protein
MDRLQRDMNRLFNRYGAPDSMRTAPSYPAINVWVNEDGQIVTAEMPGLGPDDIDITVVGDTLTISGSRGSEDLPEEARVHRHERGFGKFSRSLQLPFAVDSDKTQARFNDGILEIKLPRPETDKPRKINIKG